MGSLAALAVHTAGPVFQGESRQVDGRLERRGSSTSRVESGLTSGGSLWSSTLVIYTWLEWLD